MRNRQRDIITFPDWETAGTELQVIDEGDSVGLYTTVRSGSVDLTVNIRIRPDDTQRLIDQLTAIQSKRAL